MSAHPLLDQNERTRIDYLTVVAGVAAADGSISPGESRRLEQLCAALAVPPSLQGEIMGAVVLPPPTLGALKAQLAKSPLRYALMADCLLMAQTDGLVEAREKAELMALATALGISGEELGGLVTYVRGCISGAPDEEVLVAAGIPKAALGTKLLIEKVS